MQTKTTKNAARALATALIVGSITSCGVLPRTATQEPAEQVAPEVPVSDTASLTLEPGSLQFEASADDVNTLDLNVDPGQLTNASLIKDASASGGQAVMLPTGGSRATFTLTNTVVAGKYRLRLRARGTQYLGWPIVAFRLNGTEVSTATIQSSTYGAYTAGEYALKPGDTIDVTFTNDLYGGNSKKDRNAIVDYLILEPLTPPPGPLSGITGFAAGATLSGTVTPGAGAGLVENQAVNNVAFALTDANGTTVLSKTEYTAPYCLGGDSNGVCNSWDTTTLPDGNYLLKATGTRADGTSNTVSANLTISNPVAVAPAPAPAPVTEPAPSPAPSTLKGDLYVGANEQYKTIQAAVSAAQAGQTIVVRSGTYRESIDLNKASISLLGEPGATVKGSDVKTGWLREGAYWVIPYTAQPSLPATLDGWAVCESVTPQCGQPDQVFLDGRELWQEAQLVAVDNSSDFFVGNGKLYLYADPTGRTVEVSSRPYWLKGYADGVTVKGLSFQHASNKAHAGAAFHVNYRSNWTLEGNEFAYAAADNLDMSGSNVVVRGNDIHHGGQLGVKGSNQNSLFTGNKLHHNNTAGYNVQWEAGGSKWHQGGASSSNLPYQGVTVSENDVYENAGPGLWVDVWGNGYTFSNNKVHHNKHMGINVELSRNVTVTGNTVWENGFNLDWAGNPPTSTVVPPYWVLGAGIYILQSDDVRVSGNLVAWNADGITVWSDTRWDRTVNNVVVESNDILARTNSYGAHALAWVTTSGSAGTGIFGSGNAAQNNRYYLEGSVSLVWNNQYYSSLSAFAGTPVGVGSTTLSLSEATALSSVIPSM